MLRGPWARDREAGFVEEPVTKPRNTVTEAFAALDAFSALELIVVDEHGRQVERPDSHEAKESTRKVGDWKDATGGGALTVTERSGLLVYTQGATSSGT